MPETAKQLSGIQTWKNEIWIPDKAFGLSGMTAEKPLLTPHTSHLTPHSLPVFPRRSSK
jgi:hypothetical protein